MFRRKNVPFLLVFPFILDESESALKCFWWKEYWCLVRVASISLVSLILVCSSGHHTSLSEVDHLCQSIQFFDRVFSFHESESVLMCVGEEYFYSWIMVGNIYSLGGRVDTTVLKGLVNCVNKFFWIK